MPLATMWEPFGLEERNGVSSREAKLLKYAPWGIEEGKTSRTRTSTRDEEDFPGRQPDHVPALRVAPNDLKYAPFRPDPER